VRLLFPWINLCLPAAVLLGLIRDRHQRRVSRFLVVYLAFVVVGGLPLLLWRKQFHTWWYWLVTELVCASLALALAVDLLRLVLGRLPVGRRRSALVTAIVLLAVWLSLLVAAGPPTSASADWVYYQGSLRAAQAKCAAGILFVVLLALASRHGVPLDPLHRDVAAGFALWQLVHFFAEPLAVLDPFLGVGRQGFQRLIYTGMLIAWVQAAWRRDEASALSPAAARLLHPWRVAA
jgi:hypothetical protein